MSRKFPAFQFYPNDWLSSTKVSLMTPAEEGAYLRLLCHAWNAPDCGLPDSDEELAVLSRLGEGWFNGGSEKIRVCFTAKNGRLYNERLLATRKDQERWREKSRRGGIASGKSRRNKNLQPKGGSDLVPKDGSDLVGTKDEPKGNTSSSSSSFSFLKTLKAEGDVDNSERGAFGPPSSEKEIYDEDREKELFKKYRPHLEEQCTVLLRHFQGKNGDGGGFNPTHFIAKAKKSRIPIEVVKEVLDSMVRQKEKIKNPWGWITTVLESEYKEHNYAQALREHEERKSWSGIPEKIGRFFGG